MANPQDYTTGGGMNTISYDSTNKSFSDANTANTASSYNPIPDTSTLNNDQLNNYNKINGKNLAQSNPLTIPTSTTGAPKPNPTVTYPQGTTLDANGNALIIPPPATGDATGGTPALSAFQQTMAKIAGLGDQLSTKGAVTTQLQNDLQLQQKTEQSVRDYNNYNQTKLGLTQQINDIYNRPGITREQANQQVSEVSRVGNANLANLAVISQASQGLESAARQTIKDKIDAQFSPITDQIDFLSKFAQINQNDLSESEKFRLQTQVDQKKTDLANITKIADDLHQNMLTNGAPQSTYTALDKITNDYATGKITAQEAQSKYYSAAGSYGVDASKALDVQVKLANIRQSNAAAASSDRANRDVAPGTTGTDTPLYNGLSSKTATAVRGIVSGFKSEPQNTNFIAIQDGYDFAKAIPNTTQNPTDDQGLIYSLAKVLDPGSVVREGEYATVQKYAQSWVSAYGKGVTQAIAGTGFLSETARKNIKNTITTKYLSSKKSYDSNTKSYAEQINNLTGRNDGDKFLRSYSTAGETGGEVVDNSNVYRSKYGY